MTEEFDFEEGDEEDLFEDLDETLNNVPEGRYITLQHDSGVPRRAPLFDGEDTITPRMAISRLNLTIGAALDAYYEGNPVSLDTAVPAGAVVTLVGSVKGG